MARGVDGADVGRTSSPDSAERSRSPNSLIASSAAARCSSSCGDRPGADQNATSAACANPVAAGKVSSPDQVAPRA
jgi:hypothetical protein